MPIEWQHKRKSIQGVANPAVLTGSSIVVACDSFTKAPHFFHSYKKPDFDVERSNQTPRTTNRPSVSLPLWKTGRATTAGPAHLHPMQIGDQTYQAPTLIDHQEFTEIACEEVHHAALPEYSTGHNHIRWNWGHQKRKKPHVQCAASQR